MGVVGVQFQINGVKFGPELTGGVYTLPWDTTVIAKGSYTISAVARDAAGNRSTATINVKVKQTR